MRVTLTDGQDYALTFQHDYFEGYRATRQNKIVWDKFPQKTSAFLRKFLDDGELGDPIIYGTALKNPRDIPNKHIARQVALGRMCKELAPVDAALVQQAYYNRKAKAQKAVVA